jgi:hypothetical protein
VIVAKLKTLDLTGVPIPDDQLELVVLEPTPPSARLLLDAAIFGEHRLSEDH